MKKPPALNKCSWCSKSWDTKEFFFGQGDKVGLTIDQSAMLLMGTTPLNPLGVKRDKKRLVRIKRNLIRELKAFNKEIRRHDLNEI